MEIREFARKIQKAVIEVLGEEYEIKLHEVQKNNGVLLQGLIIMKKEQNVSPTIYLQPFWEAYEKGVTFAEVVRRIIQIYREDTPRESIDMSFFKDFEKVKDRICYKLISGEQNRELLEKLPYIPFLDLAICFYYAYECKPLGKGTILIHNSHLDMWRTDVTELMKLAQYNTPRLFPWECKSMKYVLDEMMCDREKISELIDSQEQGGFWDEMPMYIASNNQRTYGAAVILYPDRLAEFARQQKADFYILPSSVHEVILLKAGEKDSPEQLRNMIAEVNRTAVEPEEMLSDSLYYFERADKRIKILSSPK